MKNCLIILFLGCFTSVLSVAKTIEISPAGNKVTKEGVITLSADLIKPKGKKYDLHFIFSNEHTKNIIVLLNDIRCFRGGLTGDLKSGDRVSLRPGERKEENITCHLGGDGQGEYRLVVTKVYENETADGNTLGKILAKDIEWKVAVAD